MEPLAGLVPECEAAQLPEPEYTDISRLCEQVFDLAPDQTWTADGSAPRTPPTAARR